MGSIVAGPKDFIAKVHHHRKMLGGGMRQAGVLAAPGGWRQLFWWLRLSKPIVESISSTYDWQPLVGG